MHGGSQLTIVGQSRIIRIIAQQLSFLFRYIDGVFGRVRNPINQANYVILGGTKIEVKLNFPKTLDGVVSRCASITHAQLPCVGGQHFLAVYIE